MKSSSYRSALPSYTSRLARQASPPPITQFQRHTMMPSRIISTLYSFTRSDVMGVLIPTVSRCRCRRINFGMDIQLTDTDLRSLTSLQTAFGTLASGSLDPSLLVIRGFWVWLHLLQFCVSNQSVEPDEDSKNKPWRPIPAGNISLHAARRLRWLLLAACLAYSAETGVLVAGATLSFATWAHNEANLGSHWLSRNALNAIGYASFSIGASNAGCAGAYLRSFSPIATPKCSRCLVRSPRLLTVIRFARRATAHRCGDLHHNPGTGLQRRRGRHPRQSPDAPDHPPHRESAGDFAPHTIVVADLLILLSNRGSNGFERCRRPGSDHRHTILVRADTRRRQAVVPALQCRSPS